MGERRGCSRSVEGESAERASSGFNPWQHIGDKYPEWIVGLGDLAGVKEAMCVRDKVILIESSRTRSERRCDLAHAIAHIELGHHERKNKADERAAVRYAAKMLIDLQELGEALATSCGRVSEEAADLLDVDLETLTVRVQHLHPAEAGYLRRRLSSVVEDAA